ncbi:MAG: hypothetical protein DWQ05_02295 [Calditrichaeota bacterium]|nr:MAG: hypothetical protein DWQ05_02295 [Calditrichota bacterium]
MNNGTLVTNFVLDDFGQNSRLPYLISSEIKLTQLQHYKPNGSPTLFILSQKNLQIGQKFYEQMDAEAKRSSLITSRTLPNELPPVDQATGTIIIHHCNDKKFMAWLNLLAGKTVNRIYLDWFVPLKVFHPYSYSQGLLIKAFDNLPIKKAAEIQRKDLENTVHCSSFKLDYLSKQIYGLTPGRLLRIWRYFVLTEKFMTEEALLGIQPRRGRSPLRTVENDYCEALIRLLNISYTELRLAAKDQHWIAVWTAALRKSMQKFYAAP